MAKPKTRKVSESTVTIIGIKSDKTRLVEGKQYEVSKDVADVLVKSKRAKRA